MPKVTDKQFQLADFHIEKLDLAAKRVNARKLDALFLIDGDEGFGKTSLSILNAYYLAWKTKREFSLDQLFFDPKDFVNYINNNKKKIIIWDEAALGGLASAWQNRVQQLIIQTLMTCRYRQHIIFFNCPKFYRLNQYFVLDRAAGLFHVYSENGIDAGLFTFYKKETIEPMLQMWTSYKKKPYKKFYNKYLRGNFIDAFNPKNFKDGVLPINEEEYDKKKDFYTEKLLSQYSAKRGSDKLLKLQHKISQMKLAQQKEIAASLGITPQTMIEWGKIPIKYPEIFKEIN